MEIAKLKNHRYAQCGKFYDVSLDGTHEKGLISYETKVIIKRGSRVLYTGTYSRTTSRQVSWYLMEDRDGLTWDILKKMEKDAMAFNLSTREFEPLTDKEKNEIRRIRQAAFRWGYGW